ncbi:MAG: ASKHA domain-containing protein, partial [Acidimicrobiales bacterium]
MSAAPEPHAPRAMAKVEFQPLGRRTEVPTGTTLLAAARSAGVELVSVCGGLGLCGTCRVLLTTGQLSPPSAVEKELLSPAELSEGTRLACQATVTGDVAVSIPPGSLSSQQRLQVETSLSGSGDLDQAIMTVDIEVPRPSLSDLRSDATRVEASLAGAGWPVPTPSWGLLASLPGTLRAEDWAVKAVLRRPAESLAIDSSPASEAHPGKRPAHELVALLPKRAKALGAAIDIGTTKLAAYLVDLEAGQVLAKGAASNPQVTVGEDVMSRIAYAGTSEDRAEEARRMLANGINELLGKLLSEAGAVPGQLVDAVAVGNTAMHHFVLGLPLAQLGTAPYVPAVTEELAVPAAFTGLEMAPGAHVYLPPNIAGFVGADHTAALLASGATDGDRTVLLLDIGTNTEVSVVYQGRLWCCSTASGPAFEGAHIHDGMRAAQGAVERVAYLDGGFQVHTIGDVAPVGICGSGILDALAAALDAGAVDERGHFQLSHPLVTRSAQGPAAMIVPASQSGHGRDILLTRRDAGEVQLAKAAIRAGTEILLATAGAQVGSIDEVVVAGAFGTYLDIASAIAVGLLPDVPAQRYRQVGNAAGQGAQQMLLDRKSRAKASEIAQRAQYVELTTHPGFAGAFADQLMFPRRADA